MNSIPSDVSATPSLPAMLATGPVLEHLHADVRPWVYSLLEEQLLPADRTREFLERANRALGEMATPEQLGAALLAAELLTEFMLKRILADKRHGLRLGNYRVLEPIGRGTVGTVFRAEHIYLRRRVAIKVLAGNGDFPPQVLERFHAEMRVLAHLNHPHIVAAYDAGILPAPHPRLPTLHYLVMEYVQGGDLEQYLYARECPLPIPQACEWIRQAAAGLQAAHDRHLIHRDLKPSNMLLTEHGQVKLVDFGLARQFSSTRTAPRSLVGSLEFMAPEQSIDPTLVRGAADIYGLGATLFWLLTGQTPYPQTDNLMVMLRMLQEDEPRRLRTFRPDLPEDLDALVARMLARDPETRPALPITVMNALARYAAPATGTWDLLSGFGESFATQQPTSAGGSSAQSESTLPGLSDFSSEHDSSSEFPFASPSIRQQVLVVAQETTTQAIVREALEVLGCQCESVADAEAALDRLRGWHATTHPISPEAGLQAAPFASTPEASDLAMAGTAVHPGTLKGGYDLYVIEGDLPLPGGLDLCQQILAEPTATHRKILLLTRPSLAEESASIPRPGSASREIVQALARGADDACPMPLDPLQLAAKVEHLLRLKEAQDRAARLTEQLLAAHRQLEDSLLARAEDVRKAQDALLYGMAKMAESREGETRGHLLRLQQYTRCLTDQLQDHPHWKPFLTPHFLEALQRCIPLHDLGKLGLPDQLLFKPGSLTIQERALIETHPVIGSDLLDAIGREYGDSLTFWSMARSVVRHHHERFDGTGYPDRLEGDQIPPAARLVAIPDVYDALRRRRTFKSAMDHDQAVSAILHDSPGQFDPELQEAFAACHAEFDRIYQSIPG